MTDALSRLKAALADRFSIERELGSGGMATVYLAQDLKHWRQLAVKALSKRSIIENVIYRYKTIIGRCVSSRTLAGQQVEVQLACRVLNTMSRLGCPTATEWGDSVSRNGDPRLVPSHATKPFQVVLIWSDGIGLQERETTLA